MKNLSFLTTNLIAHRGLHDQNNPENSMGAFKQAVLKNYGIELDVHITKDKKVVVFHDDHLKRMTGDHRYIKDCTYQELLKLKLGDSSYRIPLLSEVLAFVHGKVPIIIELKRDQKIGVLEKEVIKILDSYSGFFAVKSFRVSSVLWFRLIRKHYVRGQLANHPISLLVNWLIQPDFISYNVKNLPNKWIAKYKKKKVVLGFTVQSKEELKRVLGYCNNFICEHFI